MLVLIWTYALYFLLCRCDFNKYTLMVLQNIGEIEESRDQKKKLEDDEDSGNDDADELMLISNTPDSDDEHEVDMYSSASED